ncbi:MAG: RES family NAD+ phosphorylase [Pseudomonadota bacterium]|nr:RES family NAD+ phosphorylase [Pseudomonadota bacterium]
MTPPRSRIEWRPGYRIVSSRFPPIGVFDDIASPADIDALFELEGRTNPRIREQLGQIQLIPAERRVSGPGTTPVMAAFTHLNRDGSRFSNGSFGVYYAAQDRDTAVAETVFHRARFLAYTREPRSILEMRCYLSDIAADLHDVRGGYAGLHDPDNYAESQRTALELRAAGSNGLVYDSVRRPGGQCVALFYPDLVASTRQSAHLYYHWNGHEMTHVVVADEVIVLAS